MREVTIDMAAIHSGGMPPGGVNLVGRETGQGVREALSRALAREEGEVLFLLDFSRVGIVDFSCADECLGKLLPRVLADEFGTAYLSLLNLSASQTENIAVALEKRGVAVAAARRRGGWTFLGKLNPYLQETFDLVYRYRRLSSRELSDRLSLALNTGSTRLMNLYKQRLVGRREHLSPRGFREFIYEGFNGGLDFA